MPSALFAAVLLLADAGVVATLPEAYPNNGVAAAGLLAQGQSHDWTHPLGGCLDAETPMRLELRALAWAPGDVLTLRARAVADGRLGLAEAATTGVPPMAVLDIVSPDGCPHFWVEGTQVRAAAVYLEVTTAG